MGDGDGGLLTAEAVSGLQAGTTYHYRVVAVNGSRTVHGADRTLTTEPAPMVEQPHTEEPPPTTDPRDVDGDGYPAGVDCNDHDRSVHPRAIDRPGDKIDQDCSGTAAAYGHLAPPIDARWSTQGKATTFTRLITGALPAHVTITLACTGPGCKLKTYTSRTTSATKHTDLLNLLKRSTLHRGATVTLRLATTGQATTIVRWQIGPPTRRATTCLAPGARKEASCS
jgi:hypothetical protein